MILPWIQLIIGLVLLSGGADVLVRGAAGLAVRMGITPLVVGLTVVAFGTSSPELVVSVQDAITGQGEIAVGTVVGSNICNIVLILGIAALVRPMVIHLQILRVDLPILVGITVVMAVVIWMGSLPRWLGGVLFLVLILYTTFTIRQARKEGLTPAVEEEFSEVVPDKPAALPVLLGLVISGSILLVVGSDLLLKGAVTMATTWGISEAVIGLTLVAVGGSLPELATSLVAALRGSGDIAVGNVVGSNIFNLLCVLAAAMVANPITVSGIHPVDLIMMVTVTVAAIPMMYTGLKLSRVEGAFLLAGYIGYVVYLFTLRSVG